MKPGKDRTKLRPDVPAEALLREVWPPMMARPSTLEHVPKQNVRCEVKYDGYRGLAAVWKGEVALFTRNGISLHDRFPELLPALAALPVKEAVLDGEVVAFDGATVSHFRDLGRTSGTHHLVVFDLLWLDGEDLRLQPDRERRRRLERLLQGTAAPLQLTESLGADVEVALDRARRRGLEGIIVKACDARYEGRRGPAWSKVKLQVNQELAIVGYTAHTENAAAIGALLLGAQQPQGLTFAGKVGTGFSDRMRCDLQTLLRPDLRASPAVKGAPRLADAHWVTPRHVAQLEFTEWTEDGRLRHPSFQGLRLDKRPEQTAPELPARALPPRKAPRVTSARKPRLPKVPDVVVTHADRVVFPELGLTKKDVVDYVREVGPAMAAAIKDRPLTLQQWPAGIHAPGFFRQNVHHAPAWIPTVSIAHDGRDVEHVLVDRPETLAWLANQSALTLHMWSARTDALEQPDWVVFDFDPGDGPFSEVIELALALRGFLEELGLESFPKTSGKRGLHVLLPFRRGPGHTEATDFAVAITQTLAQAYPGIATTERMKAARGGRMYLDAFQNGRGKTVVAPYSLRAVPQATVSTPLEWSEVQAKLSPLKYTWKTVPRRLDKYGDLFAPLLHATQQLPKIR